ncbi:MAG: hypothetical protein H7Z76_14620 [Methylotenera sp.]|nr:hypothetical protein [Flavobacterium sp.]
MKHHILVGHSTVENLKNENYISLEEDIENNDGDIFCCNSKKDYLPELLELLKGWSEFIELSKQQVK